jgi:transcriptional regulator with XRE-family HTH domain
MVKLRAQRQTKLMSIRDLAEAAGVAPQTIVTAESGKRRPHPSTMLKIAEALGVDAKEIDEFAEAIRIWIGEGGDD